MDSLEFSLYKLVSSANGDSFTSLFPTCMSFVTFSCLIAWQAPLVPRWLEVVRRVLTWTRLEPGAVSQSLPVPQAKQPEGACRACRHVSLLCSDRVVTSCWWQPDPHQGCALGQQSLHSVTVLAHYALATLHDSTLHLFISVHFHFLYFPLGYSVPRFPRGIFPYLLWVSGSHIFDLRTLYS